MTRFSQLGLAFISLVVLASCATTVDGTRISGRAHDVSPEDIRQAVGACSDSSTAHRRKPWQIEVVSRDEIHVYWFKQSKFGGSYDIAKRARGKWTCKDMALIIPSERSNQAMQRTGR
jgi:hypothetical protein